MSKQSGEKFPVYGTLTDDLGVGIDTEVHLHCYVDGLQILIKRRSEGGVEYLGAGRYRANVRFDLVSDTCIDMVWHCPDLEYQSPAFQEIIEGKTVSEVL